MHCFPSRDQIAWEANHCSFCSCCRVEPSFTSSTVSLKLHPLFIGSTRLCWTSTSTYCMSNGKRVVTPWHVFTKYSSRAVDHDCFFRPVAEDSPPSPKSKPISLSLSIRIAMSASIGLVFCFRGIVQKKGSEQGPLSHHPVALITDQSSCRRNPMVCWYARVLLWKKRRAENNSHPMKGCFCCCFALVYHHQHSLSSPKTGIIPMTTRPFSIPVNLPIATRIAFWQLQSQPNSLSSFSDSWTVEQHSLDVAVLLILLLLSCIVPPPTGQLCDNMSHTVVGGCCLSQQPTLHCQTKQTPGFVPNGQLRSYG
jgi:hypothetical protein